MTKKELRKYYWLRKNIKILEEELYKLETKARNITPIIKDEPRVPGIDVRDKVADLVAKVVDLENIINEKLYESYVVLEKIEKAIDKLPEREKYLIRSRYIDFKRWEEIAVDMNYSYRQVHNIHSYALQLLKKSAHNCTNRCDSMILDDIVGKYNN